MHDSDVLLQKAEDYAEDLAAFLQEARSDQRWVRTGHKHLPAHCRHLMRLLMRGLASVFLRQVKADSTTDVAPKGRRQRAHSAKCSHVPLNIS